MLHDHKEESFRPKPIATKFKQMVNAVLKEYTALANLADQGKTLLFAVTPKSHWLWHTGIGHTS